MKLTLISMYVQGHKFTRFVMLPYDSDGRVRLTENQLFHIMGVTVPRGTTYNHN